MFKYITNVNRLSRSVINLYTPGFEVAVDCTLGNGHDTDFLSEIFKKVCAFDIQKKQWIGISKKI